MDDAMMREAGVDPKATKWVRRMRGDAERQRAMADEAEALNSPIPRVMGAVWREQGRVMDAAADRLECFMAEQEQRIKADG